MDESTSSERAKTMKDIARLAGVSSSTASRALQDSPLISEATKEKVRHIAKKHGYRPHLGARNLRLKKTNTVVAILPFQFGDESVLANPYILKMLGEVGSSLRTYGYDLLLSRLEDIEPTIDDLYIHGGLADGAIIMGRGEGEPEKLAALTATGIPFVVLGPHYEDQNYCSVGIDNVASAHKAVTHLLKLGRRRIAIIADNFDNLYKEGYLRFQGYKKALTDWGLPVDETLFVHSITTGEASYTAVKNLINQSPDVDAIFAVGDVQAIAAIKALEDNNRSVPEDVAVVGFDNIELCNFTIPPLTSVSQRLRDGVAELLVDKLMQLIDGQEVESAMLEGNLVVRQSCGTHLANS